MSRVYMSEDMTLGAHELWTANAERAIRGKAGRRFLRELRAAMEALPDKRLIEGSFSLGGEVCAMGAVAVQREIAAGKTREEALALVEEVWGGEGRTDDDGASIGREALGLTYVLAWELAFLNDGDGYDRARTTPEDRYRKVMKWIDLNLDTTKLRSGESPADTRGWT